jgi:peptidoglycan/LPS O-acetylase OafA/YrhL
MAKVQYRPDIDGLRAVAVLAVLGFHAFPGYVPGGFVGVDVFFVISGFLISGIIMKELDEGEFSYLQFYRRRVRRILPALVITLVAVSRRRLLLMLPDEYEQLGRHVAGASIFASNFLLWQESGYFDTEASLKPLLHLWSLAIEEQFYIVWPLILAALWKLQRAKIAVVIAAIAAVSFALNVLTIDAYPTATFYWPVTRFWELMLGALLASLQSRLLLPSAVRASLSFTGFAMVAGSIALFSPELAFPGWIGAIPTVGTVFMIGAGPGTWLNLQLLSRPLIVFVGLVSYPLYLWHWPILVLARYWESGSVPSASVRLVLLAVAFGLAVLTFLLVERPIRLKSFAPRRAIALVAALLSIGTASVFAEPIRQSIAPSSYSVGVAQLQWDYWENDNCTTRYHWTDISGWWFCVASSREPATLIVLGDSHANHLYPGLLALPQRVVSIGTCAPVIGIYHVGDDVGENPCSGERMLAQQTFLNGVLTETPSIRYAILADAWPAFDSEGREIDRFTGTRAAPSFESVVEDDKSRTPREKFLRALERRIASLTERGIAPIIAFDIPLPPYDVRACLDRPFHKAAETCSVELEPYLRSRDQFVQGVKEIQARYPQVLVFDPAKALCDETTCRFRTKDEVFLRDTDHLSVAGSRKVGTAFVEWARNALPDLLISPVTEDVARPLAN